MTRRIVLIQGHPDTRGGCFGHALAEAYTHAAQAAGHEVRLITVAGLDFPLLRTKEDYETGTPPDGVREGQASIAWAEHLVIVFPLWLGGMPALLRAYLEQVLRPGFAFDRDAAGLMGKRLTGKSARIVVTMGMPAFVYRWYFRAHGIRNLERSILRFCGIRPVRTTVIGMVEGAAARRAAWLARMRDLGRMGK